MKGKKKFSGVCAPPRSKPYHSLQNLRRCSITDRQRLQIDFYFKYFSLKYCDNLRLAQGYCVVSSEDRAHCNCLEKPI